MTFLAPLLLLGLLLVPILLGLYAWAQRRRSRYAVRFTNLDLLANLAPRRPAWRRHVPPAIYLAAVAALVIGLARPSMVVAVPREDATVLLAIDVSGSMKATDVAPTRLDAAREAAQSFIDQLPEGIRVGIVAFASRPVTLVAPTADRGQLDAALDGLRALDGTAMGDALMQVLDIAETIQAGDAGSAGGTTPGGDTASPDPSAAPAPSAAPPLGRAGQPGRHADAASRWWPRSSCPTAPTPSVSRNRSTRPSEPRASASRSTRSPSARRPARSRSGTISARWSRWTCRPTPRRSPRSRRSRVRRRSMPRPPSDLSAVYDNLQSRIGYTQEEQEVTSWFAAGALALVVVAAGLSAVWFGRLP